MKVQRTLAATAAAATVGICALGAQSASALTIKGTCLEEATGQTTIGPGPVTSERTFLSTGTSQDFACHLPDPTITSDTQVWSQTGTAVCLPVIHEVATGSDTFTWSNGRTSLMSYSDDLIDDADYTTGVFVSGEFTGLRVTWLGAGTLPFSNPFGSVAGIISWCALGQQATAPAGYTGVMTIN